MAAVLKMPGVKVSRTAWLQAALSRHCSTEQLQQVLTSSPPECLPLALIDKLAGRCIARHSRHTAALSTVAGLPGGLALAAAIPADVVQGLYHTLKLSQELAYLYGFPDLCDERGQLANGSTQVLTVMTGVMMGASVATIALSQVCEHAARQTLRTLPQSSIARSLIYPLAKSIGLQITQQRATKTVTRAVPLLGGAVAGILTYTAFKPAAHRLKAQLRSQMPALLAAYHPPHLAASTTPPPLWVH